MSDVTEQALSQAAAAPTYSDSRLRELAGQSIVVTVTRLPEPSIDAEHARRLARNLESLFREDSAFASRWSHGRKTEDFERRRFRLAGKKNITPLWFPKRGLSCTVTADRDTLPRLRKLAGLITIDAPEAASILKRLAEPPETDAPRLDAVLVLLYPDLNAWHAHCLNLGHTGVGTALDQAIDGMLEQIGEGADIGPIEADNPMLEAFSAGESVEGSRADRVREALGERTSSPIRVAQLDLAGSKRLVAAGLLSEPAETA